MNRSYFTILGNGDHTFCGILTPNTHGSVTERYFHFDGFSPPNTKTLFTERNGKRVVDKIIDYNDQNIDRCDWALMLPVSTRTAKALRDFFDQITLDYDHLFEQQHSGTGEKTYRRIPSMRGLAPYSYVNRLKPPKPGEGPPAESACNFFGVLENPSRQGEGHVTTNCIQSVLQVAHDIAGIDLQTLGGRFPHLRKPEQLQGALSVLLEKNSSQVAESESITSQSLRLGKQRDIHAYFIDGRQAGHPQKLSDMLKDLQNNDFSVWNTLHQGKVMPRHAKTLSLRQESPPLP